MSDTFEFLYRYTLPPMYHMQRVGRNNDGGYVIVEPFTYDCLISAGIADDTSFEQQFLQLYSDIPCFAFDGTYRLFHTLTPRE